MTLSQDQVKSLLQAVSYSNRLVDVYCLTSATHRSAVLNKINNHGSSASLGKEDYPDSGRKLFGVGFEARLKARAETAFVQQVMGVPRSVFYTEAPPAPSEAAHIAAEVRTELLQPRSRARSVPGPTHQLQRQGSTAV